MSKFHEQKNLPQNCICKLMLFESNLIMHSKQKVLRSQEKALLYEMTSY